MSVLIYLLIYLFLIIMSIYEHMSHLSSISSFSLCSRNGMLPFGIPSTTEYLTFIDSLEDYEDLWNLKKYITLNCVTRTYYVTILIWGLIINKTSILLLAFQFRATFQ